MCSVFQEHVVDANLYLLLLFVLPITIEGGISKSPDEIKESFGRLLFRIVKGDDGDLFLTWKYLVQKLSTISSYMGMELG